MDSTRSNRRRTHKARRQARAAAERAQALLDRLAAAAAMPPSPGPAGLAAVPALEEPENRRLVTELREELAILAMSPKLRIVAVRRRQGAVSRRQTTTQALFAACTEVRRRIKVRYRGPRHAELRRAFGEGLAASAAKPETTLRFAQKVLEAAAENEAALREVRVGPPTLRRVAALCEKLRSSTLERGEWRSAQQQISENLERVVSRVGQLCDEIERALRLPLAPGAGGAPAVPEPQLRRT